MHFKRLWTERYSDGHVNVLSILLIGAISAPIAACAAWLIARMELGWDARQRVFNAASIAPTILAMGMACFATVILTIGNSKKFEATVSVLLQTITAILASFISGMLAAYLVERARKK
jgi:hypothetical protein